MEVSISDQLVSIRRHLHQIPEIGYQETETSKYICEQLDLLEISYQKGFAGGTGVLAEISKGKGKTVLLRADIDALPMQEITGLEFASKNQGVMHACGHDMHTTMLLGSIMKLKDADFEGKVKFIFQPSEEGTNGDKEKKSGGQRVVEEGVLDGVDFALALHVNPLAPVGMLNYTPGTALACAGNFTIEVFGKSSHAGAAPHLAIDAVLIGTALVQAFQSIVARNVAPNDEGVVSVSSFHGGTAPNVIADYVKMTGTLRAMTDENFEMILGKIKQIIDGISKAYGAEIKFTLDSHYLSVINDPAVHERLESVGNSVFKMGLHPIPPTLGAEDFAFYSRKVPSMFYFIGAMSEQKGEFFLHHPKVIFNEDCMVLGSKFLAKSALELLK